MPSMYPLANRVANLDANGPGALSLHSSLSTPLFVPLPVSFPRTFPPTHKFDVCSAFACSCGASRTRLFLLGVNAFGQAPYVNVCMRPPLACGAAWARSHFRSLRCDAGNTPMAACSIGAIGALSRADTLAFHLAQLQLQVGGEAHSTLL